MKSITTTRQVVDYIRSFTAESKQSLWASLPAEHRGVPTVAISHSWDYSFQFLIDTLKFNREGGPAELRGVQFIWLDIFALTQHADGSTKQKEEISQLGNIFGEQIPFVALVLPRSSFRFGTERNSLGALDRAWCVFELARAFACGARFTFLLPTDNNTDWEGPCSMTRYWKPWSSKAFLQSDKDSMDDLVLRTFNTWNTLKVVSLMVFLELNNSGDMFWKSMGTDDGLVKSSVRGWDNLFRGSTESWALLHRVYIPFYYGYGYKDDFICPLSRFLASRRSLPKMK
jgi:hypothetical protein